MPRRHVIFISGQFNQRPSNPIRDPIRKPRPIPVNPETLHVMHILNTIGGGNTNGNDVEVGFRRIASLKPQLLTFWTNHDQVAQLLAQGDAWITPWPSDRLITLKSHGAPVNIVIPKEGVPFGTSEIGISK